MAAADQASKVTFLGMIPVILEGSNGRSVTTYAMLDNGSTQSFCDERLVEMLGLSGRRISYSVSTVTSKSHKGSGFELDITVHGVATPFSFQLKNVWTMKHLGLSPRNAARNDDIRSYPHLDDITLPSIEPKEVLLLIGIDCEVMVPLEIRRSGKKNEPYAESTPLGWVVRGPSWRAKVQREASVCFLQPEASNPVGSLKRDSSDHISRKRVGCSVKDGEPRNSMRKSLNRGRFPLSQRKNKRWHHKSWHKAVKECHKLSSENPCITEYNRQSTGICVQSPCQRQMAAPRLQSGQG